MSHIHFRLRCDACDKIVPLSTIQCLNPGVPTGKHAHRGNPGELSEFRLIQEVSIGGEWKPFEGFVYEGLTE